MLVGKWMPCVIGVKFTFSPKDEKKTGLDSIFGGPNYRLSSGS